MLLTGCGKIFTLKLKEQKQSNNEQLSNFNTITVADANGKTQLLHSLNGSSLALPRIIACLLENNQTPEGIKIPAVLRPYTGFDIIPNE
mgnify:CR=1 FL=1